jgi:hypothetical protein
MRKTTETTKMPENMSIAPDARALLVHLVEEREEQLLALAISIGCQLSDPGPDTQHRGQHTAWRLAQLLESELSSTKYRNAIRDLVA